MRAAAATILLAIASAAPAADQPAYSPYAAQAHPTRVFFGDTHLHTSFSTDAGMVGNRLGPVAAYRFARGETIVSSTGVPARLIRPLDFLVVTDHAEHLGIAPLIVEGSPVVTATELGRQLVELVKAGDLGKAHELWQRSKREGTNAQLFNEATLSTAWQRITAAAEKYNDPGRLANLALSLSQDYDRSVLLIDADLRKPELHHLFNVSPDSGLSDCIAEDRDIGSALITIGNGNLTFLSSGTRTENPVELFSSQRMQKALRDMKYRYPDRYVIIDMPPVLLFAETKMLSSFVDGIIFVIKEGRARMQQIVDALDALKGENMLGIVYNAVTPDGKNGRSAYHSYYSDYQK